MQERVDLHVEAGTERGDGAGAPGDPAVDRVEDERHGGQRDQRRRPAPAASNESTVSAATPPTSVARASVTRSAGPSAARPDRCRPRVSSGAGDQPVRELPPASRRRRDRRSGPGRRAGRAGRSARSAGRFEPWAPCLRRLWEAPDRVARSGATVRFAGEEDADDARRQRLLAARARRGRDPAGHAARTRARARCSSAPVTPASAGAPRPWSSPAACRRASTPRCARRSRRATSRAR